MIDMTASELMHEQISKHAYEETSHVKERLSDDAICWLGVAFFLHQVRCEFVKNEGGDQERVSKQASEQVVFPPWITWTMRQ